LGTSQRRRLQPLVQGLECQSTSPLCFLTFAGASISSTALVAKESWQASFASGQHLLVSRSDIILRERPQDLYSHQKCIDLIGDKGNRGLHDIREQAGKSKGLARVALDAEAIGRCSGEIGLLLVESEVGPASQEAEPGQHGGGVRSDQDTTEGIEEQKQGGEMLHAHLDKTLEDSDGVLGDKLFESNEEGGLNGDTTADLGETVVKNGQSCEWNRLYRALTLYFGNLQHWPICNRWE